MSTFNFLPQSPTVENLLNACVAALPQLPKPEKAVMVAALKQFEIFTVPTAWSAEDVGDELELTPSEKEEAISRFSSAYTCKDADWDAITQSAQEVLKEREVCLRIEYSPTLADDSIAQTQPFTGERKVVFIPDELVSQLAKMADEKEDTADFGLKAAFKQATGLPVQCMLFDTFNPNIQYNQYGDVIGSMNIISN